jgi:glutamate synthase domain-containing protein 1
MMTRIPYRLFERDLKAHGFEVPNRDRIGVVMAFLPREDVEETRRIIADALEANGLKLLLWRTVPTGPNVLSETASLSLPAIEQAIVQAGTTIPDEEAMEKALFLARKQIESVDDIDGFSIVSASARTVVYKGLFTADTIAEFYWDLRDQIS